MRLLKNFLSKLKKVKDKVRTKFKILMNLVKMKKKMIKDPQLKKSLVQLEAKIAEAKTKKDMLKARAQAAQAQEQLQSAVGNLGTNSAMAAFERMEEKVQTLEARSQAAAELAGADLESQFAALEGAPEVDDELAAMKQRLSGAPAGTALPGTSAATPQLEPVKVTEVDAELEELKRSIDKL